MAIRTIAIVSCILLLSGCQEQSESKEQSSEQLEIVDLKKNVAEKFLRIDGPTDTLRNYELQSNLFGKFHRQRAEFYIIENPNKTIYNHPVKRITLYFLDGALAKTKYELEDDISDDLIYSYGGFSITGYDTLTKRLLKTGTVLQKVDQRKVLNKQLINYQLKWDVPSKFIYTRVDKSGAKKRFEYIETVKDYNRRYKQLEGL